VFTGVHQKRILLKLKLAVAMAVFNLQGIFAVTVPIAIGAGYEAFFGGKNITIECIFQLHKSYKKPVTQH